MRLFIALFALTTPIVAQHPGPVVISELMWSGSSASSADEWIELYNRSNATFDLSGWTLTRGSDDAIMLVLETGSIAAGGVFLIANYAADHEKSRLAAHPHHVTTAVSLPNTKLLLRLYDRDPLADGRLVETADDGRGTPLADDGTTKKAMVRTIFHRAGDQPDSWATATEQSGWDAGASEWGTPGSIPARLLPDHPTGVDTLTELTTWTTLKKPTR